jgi:hypothetical protein
MRPSAAEVVAYSRSGPALALKPKPTTFAGKNSCGYHRLCQNLDHRAPKGVSGVMINRSGFMTSTPEPGRGRGYPGNSGLSRGMDELIPNLVKFAPQLRRTIMLPGCGHWTQQERAGEVNAAMIEFLRSL